MGLYVSTEQVKVRLAGKVRFTEDPEVEGEEGKMSLALLNRLITEAEGQVELDLSPRYAAPFCTIEGRAFSNLPARPTRAVIQTLCELMAVMRVLETDFGRGSAIDGSKYFENQEKRYKAMVWGDAEKKTPGLMSLREGTFNTYALPPLPGIKLNYQNKADTGFMGIAVADSNFDDGSFAPGQINDPSEDFINGQIDDPEGTIGG